MPLVTGNWRDILNAPMTSEQPEIIFTLNKANMAGGTVYPSEPVIITPASDGTFSANLAATQEMVDIGWYTIKLRWLGLSSGAALMDFPDWKITVPRSGGVISNLLDRPATNQRVVWVSLTPPVAPRPFMLWLEQDPQATQSDSARLYEWRAGGWSPHGHGSWSYIADLKGAPGYNATGAAEDMQAIADYILGLSGDNPVYQAVLNRGPFINVRAHGAKGDGATNDTAAIRKAFNLVRDGDSFNKPGAGTVYFPPGTYRVEEELSIYRGTTVLGEGATLKRQHSGYLLLNGNRGVNQSGYNGHGNLRFIGITLDANAAQQSGVGSTFTMGHAHDVVFERVKFLNATSHAVDCNASRKVRFRDCDFLGYRNPDANTFVEAIQIDLAVAAGFPAFGSYDCTPCADIVVEGCRFGASSAYPAHPRGVGSHGGRIGAQHEGIKIEGNTFEGHGSVAIRPYNWADVDIQNNKIYGDNGGILANTPIVGDGTSDNTKDTNGVQTGAGQACYGLRIRGNTIVGSGTGIRLLGTATGRFQNSAIESNRLYGRNGGIGAAIQGSYFRSLAVCDNHVRDFGGTGINFADEDSGDADLLLEGNSVQSCAFNGIFVQGTTDVRIVNNETWNIGTASDNTYAHVRLTGNVVNATIMGHQARQASGQANRSANGLYASASVTGVIRVGNNWRGSSVVSVADSSASSATPVGELV